MFHMARILSATCLLLAVTALAQSVTYDYDKSADFSRFKTYAWIRGAKVNDELNDKRIVDAVDAQLAAKGLTRVEADAKPDLVVFYRADFQRELQINGSGWGGYRFGGNRFGTATAREAQIGTLTVEMLDATTRAVVWKGTATKDVDTGAKPDKRDKSINKAAEKMFKNFPPKR